jgi:hypothetical protein
MDIPDKIWATPDVYERVDWTFGDWGVINPDAKTKAEYTLSLLSDAQVGAAYEAAAVICKPPFIYPPKNKGQPDYQSGAILRADLARTIRTLTPADALSAMKLLIDEAVEAERERCALICDAIAKLFLSTEYATGQPLSSFQERFACGEIKAAIQKEVKP